MQFLTLDEAGAACASCDVVDLTGLLEDSNSPSHCVRVAMALLVLPATLPPSADALIPEDSCSVTFADAVLTCDKANDISSLSPLKIVAGSSGP